VGSGSVGMGNGSWLAAGLVLDGAAAGALVCVEPAPAWLGAGEPAGWVAVRPGRGAVDVRVPAAARCPDVSPPAPWAGIAADGSGAGTGGYR
jgi:hypothetical protein